MMADYHFKLTSVVTNSLQNEIKRLRFCINPNKSRCILQKNHVYLQNNMRYYSHFRFYDHTINQSPHKYENKINP